MLELCKTRTKQSNPDLLTFYVISGGHDMVNDAGTATTCRRKLKAPWLQTKSTKNEGSYEKMSFNAETVWKFQTKKNQKNPVIVWRTKKRTTRPRGQKLNMNHVARKNLTEAKLKKAFRIKLLELCKTTSKKSSPDMFNFWVISAGYDMANDAGRATKCKRNFKAPWLQTERTKNEGSSEKMSFNAETVWKFQTKKNQKIQSSYGEQNKRTTRTRKQKLNMNHVARKNLTEAKLKKAFRIKLLELCKTRTKKSSPDLFNFYVTSSGHHMADDAGRATTCRRNFKAPWLQTERTQNEGSSEKMSFNAETVWKFRTKKNQKIQSSYGEQNKRTTRTRRQKLNMNHVARKNLAEAKLKKAFRIKLLELCKTRT